MKIAIIGPQQTGKTTLLKSLSKDESSVSFEKENIKDIKIYDKNVLELSSYFNPKKTTFATLTFVDVPGIPTGFDEKKRRNELLSSIRQFDALVVVLDAFSKEDFLTDIKLFDSDLILFDLDVVEKRLEKLAKEKFTPEKALEQKTLLKFKDSLDKEIPLRNLELTNEENLITKSFGLFTIKPTLYVMNIDEDKIKNSEEMVKTARENINFKNTEFVCLPILLLYELEQLSDEEKQEFLNTYNLKQDAISEVVENALKLLDLNVFYTVGEDEVRAWLFERGLNAKRVAGKIHSDIERGFIAAEVISYKDFKSVNFSFKEAKANGLLRIEGANYIVQDKEIVHFRFNV
ncbi:MAG: DUF933 domain-containing protein [Caldisericaceae bacterium]